MRLSIGFLGSPRQYAPDTRVSLNALRIELAGRGEVRPAAQVDPRVLGLA